MSNKIPRVQITWRKFSEELPEKLSILDGFKILQDIQEVLYDLIIPHIIATHWYSSFSRPRKYVGHRKNRNI